jgi:hypothetical protein
MRPILTAALFATVLTLAGATGAIATCGDGIIDGGEACDNGVGNGPDSCCAEDCQLRPAGSVCPPLAPCQIPPLCDGVSPSCPAPISPDTDGDGLCDAIDHCTNVGGAQDFVAGQKLMFVGHAKSQKFVATFDLPAGTSFADLDPGANGATLSVTSLPPGSFDAGFYTPPGTLAINSGRGWLKASRRWKYVDNATPRAWPRRITIYDRSNSHPGRVVVKVTGNAMGAVSDPSNLPLDVSFLPGGLFDAIAGRCGEGVLTATECSFSTKGMVCRK